MRFSDNLYINNSTIQQLNSNLIYPKIRNAGTLLLALALAFILSLKTPFLIFKGKIIKT